MTCKQHDWTSPAYLVRRNLRACFTPYSVIGFKMRCKVCHKRQEVFTEGYQEGDEYVEVPSQPQPPPPKKASKSEELKQHIRNLLEILGSDWIRSCESLSWTRGHQLDRPTSERYGAMQDAARAAIGEEAPKKE